MDIEDGSGTGVHLSGSSMIKTINDCHDPLDSDCVCHTDYSFYDEEEKLLLGLVALPIVVFGLFSNVLSAKIFTHKTMFSSSINWYLAVLSISDTVILVRYEHNI